MPEKLEMRNEFIEHMYVFIYMLSAILLNICNFVYGK